QPEDAGTAIRPQPVGAADRLDPRHGPELSVLARLRGVKYQHVGAPGAGQEARSQVPQQHEVRGNAARARRLPRKPGQPHPAQPVRGLRHRNAREEKLA
ncbi:unnamed protein product, partial [Amoebophrya sp. A120]